MLTIDTSAGTAAKQFQTTASLANVYFVRQSNGFGDTLEEQISVDGQSVGAVAPNTFILLNVPPGHHVITVAGPTNSEQALLDALAGNNYSYAVSIKWAGPMIRHRPIEAMSDADGRAAVASTKLVVTTTDPAAAPATNPSRRSRGAHFFSVPPQKAHSVVRSVIPSEGCRSRGILSIRYWQFTRRRPR